LETLVNDLNDAGLAQVRMEAKLQDTEEKSAWTERALKEKIQNLQLELMLAAIMFTLGTTLFDAAFLVVTREGVISRPTRT
jgi:uncharacterized protein (DUF2252 family)